MFACRLWYVFSKVKTKKNLSGNAWCRWCVAVAWDAHRKSRESPERVQREREFSAGVHKIAV
jgi:hypothetical protein